MRRGDIVTVALQGDKPRPAVIIQADDLFAGIDTVIVLPITSEVADLPLTRVALEPGDATGLRLTSQIMVARLQFALREKIGLVIGRVDARTMLEVERKLAVLLGLAG